MTSNMILKLVLFLLLILSKAESVKNKPSQNKTIAEIKKNLEEHELKIIKANKTKHDPVRITNYEKAKLTPKPASDKTDIPKIITTDL